MGRDMQADGRKDCRMCTKAHLKSGNIFTDSWESLLSNYLAIESIQDSVEILKYMHHEDTEKLYKQQPPVHPSFKPPPTPAVEETVVLTLLLKNHLFSHPTIPCFLCKFYSMEMGKICFSSQIPN